MTREAVPLVAPDVGDLARALGCSLAERHADKPAPPGHLELFNLSARAAGHRSYQVLRAAVRLPVATKTADDAPPRPR